MQRPNTHPVIRSLQRKWYRQALLGCLFIALALTLIVTVLLHQWAQASWWWGLPVALLSLLLLLVVNRSWKVQEADVVRYLNQTCPELEESAGLLLKPVSDRNWLEQLQVSKLEQRIANLPQLHPLRSRLRAALLVLIAACTSAVVLAMFARRSFTAPSKAGTVAAAPVVEHRLPGIASVTVHITPPAYTGKGMRTQQQFALTVEEGARVQWLVNTTMPAAAVQLLFNDSTTLALQPANAAHTQWSIQKNIQHAGFYQVQLKDKLSELYKIEVIKDQPPVITIQTPKPYSVIDYGQPQKVPVQLTIIDDYGVKDAFITATIASGNGEAVKFKEQKIAFDNSFNGHQPGYALSKTINLAALGMQPGDELYFYVQSVDTHDQQTRSDVLIVSLPDTAQLMSLDGMVNGVNLKPEYFRSERQIIIETEQLLREKDTIPAEAFKNRSNDLGIDQKLLRLRYGKFLGEEAESNIGDPRLEGEAEPDDPKDFGNAAKILDQFTDKHDNAEDASFLEPETKQQLKATLTEMWNAELKLRTFKPQEALPYAYKALRLLKDLQQKSRAYVAKTGVKITPLKPEKRLTGDLSKIGSPLTKKQYDAAAPEITTLRTALGLLEQLKTGNDNAAHALPVLQQAAQALNKQAAAQPAQYLPALEGIRRIVAAVQQQAKPAAADINTVAHALQQLLPVPENYPAARQTGAADRLSQQYYRNLNRTGKP